MAKIYVNSKTKKLLDEGIIILEKKYVKIHEYLLSIFLMPNVLINIVMEYINYDFIVKYRFYADEVYITKITQTDTNKELITNECSILYFNKTEYHSAHQCIYVLHTNTFDCIEIKYNIVDYIIISDYFDYFMKKYYNKENYTHYFARSDCYSRIKEIDKYVSYISCGQNMYVRAIDYRKTKEVIVIFKILCNLLQKKFS